MQLGIFDRYGHLICKTAKLDSGHYPAEEMRALVAAWPEPEKALQFMGVDAATLPILFVDVPFEFIGTWMLGLLDKGEASWPVVWLPVEAVEDWADDVGAKTLRGYLNGHRLSLGISKGSTAEVRGWQVRLCDFRLMFLEGFTYEAEISSAEA